MMAVLETTKVFLQLCFCVLLAGTSLASGEGSREWSSWSECSQTCGYGVEYRHRPCLRGDHAECDVSELGQLKRCKIRECPIDGGWSSWGRWRSCSKTCGLDGVRIRYRGCSNPKPQFGGLPCQGERREEMPCSSLQPCPIDGEWTAWTDWGPCRARVCRKLGNRVRKRSCSNPEPQHGGRSCDGSGFQTEKCKKAGCPVHGGWSQWTDSSECSSPCGYSTRNQTRSCTNPIPTNGGKECEGESSKQVRCWGLPDCEGESPSLVSSWECESVSQQPTTPELVEPEESPLSSVSSVLSEGAVKSSSSIPDPATPGEGILSSWVSAEFDNNPGELPQGGSPTPDPGNFGTLSWISNDESSFGESPNAGESPGMPGGGSPPAAATPVNSDDGGLPECVYTSDSSGLSYICT
ncbi:coadhesin-like [Lytechinus variegatus]|uniref:coadhesin-like n=1 Tax=Lytechinus variegatus TaxID=7654 RepID=UPI001BB11B25|nr:coadhesin-like [Lytechinus variegatus]